MTGISLRDVCKVYPLGKASVQALSGISLDIEPGEIVCFTGPSGSGKSTLLHLLGLIDFASAGTLTLFGQDIRPENEKRLSAFRHEALGFVFQSFSLIPVLTVRENVAYPLRRSPLSAAERRRRVEAMLERVGLSGFGGRFPNALSGGERQRVAVARALVGGPSLVLADEPTASLDSVNGAAVVDLLHTLSREARATVVLATHDPLVSARADRSVTLRDGRIAP